MADQRPATGDPIPPLEEEEEARFKGVVMEFEGMVCPPKYVNEYTPLEFQELAATFKENDIDGSGSIDLGELTTMLSNMDIVFSEGALLELIDEIDEDSNGTIEFSEFVALVARIKAGDKALRGFAKLVDVLNNSPMNLVQQQAQERGVDISYVQVEIRQDHIANVKYHVYECQLTGDWYEEFEGSVRCVNEMRRFQGIGRSTRDAKQKAATAALKKLKAFMPGIKFKPGKIPPIWTTWLADNFKRGAPVGEVLKRLKVKGFVPSKNDQLMQYAIGFSSFADFLESDPANASILDEEDGRVSDRLLLWAHNLVQIGMDGAILVHVLDDWGLEIQDLPALVQTWRHNTGNPIADDVLPKFLNFWQCCVEGYEKGVALYLAAGQNVDEAYHLRRNSEMYTGLAFASLHGKADICKVLVANKASTTVADVKGRTPLHLAASVGSVPVLEVLTADAKCDLFASDAHGNTALHLAARENQKEAVQFLARLATTTTFRIVYGHSKINGKVFEELVCETFAHFKATRCPQHEQPRFLKEWIYDATIYIHEKLLPAEFQLGLKCPEKGLVEEIISTYDPDPECGRWQKVGDRHIWERNVTQPEDLAVIVCKAFKDAGVNCINKIKRTPLHLACHENQVDSHKEIIQDLVERFGVLLGLKDVGGLTAYDLCMQRRNRVGSPKGTDLRESFITDKRPEHVRIIRKKQEAERAEANRSRQAAILENACTDGRSLALQSWEIMTEVSPIRRALGECKEYVDLDTGNLFYSYEVQKPRVKKTNLNFSPAPKGNSNQQHSNRKTAVTKDKDNEDEDEDEDEDEIESKRKKAQKRNENDSDDGSTHSNSDGGSSTYSDSDEEDRSIRIYSWEPSPHFVRQDAFLNGWEAVHRRSVSIRSVGAWEVLRHTATGNFFYLHAGEHRFQCTVPAELDWVTLDQSSKVLKQAGKRDEWDILQTSDGALYYRSNENMWKDPDEEERKRKQQEEERAALLAKSSLKYPSRRTPVAKAFASLPVVEAKTIVISYRWEQPLFAVEKSDVPGLCTVTTTNSATPQKILQGYYTCDQCHQGVGGQRVRVVRSVQTMRKYCVTCAAVCHQDHRGLRYVKKAFFICECANSPSDCLNTDMYARELRERLLASQQLADDRRIEEGLQLSPAELVFVPPRPGSHGSVGGDWSICRQVPGKKEALEGGWVAYYNPQQPERLQEGTEVLGPINGWYGKYQGRVIGVSEKNYNLYLIQYRIKQEKEHQQQPAGQQSSQIQDPAKQEVVIVKKEEHVHRSELTVSSPRQEFYFCSETLESQWEPPISKQKHSDKHRKKEHQPKTTNAKKNPLVSRELDLKVVLNRFPRYTAAEYETMITKAELRRRLGGILEYADAQTKALFYVLEKEWTNEHIVIKIQRVWRQKATKRLPSNWYSTAVAFIKPPSYLVLEIQLSGWAVLQRRSSVIRSIEDVNNTAWQERRETDSLEVFYYDPRENRWRWQKPEVASVAARMDTVGADLKLGEKILFRFEGRGREEAAIVTHISATDEGEDSFEPPEHLYDVRSCADSAVIKKFVKRFLIRKVPKTSVEMKFEKEERELTQVYKQYKAAEEKRERNKQQAALIGVINKARRKKETTSALVLNEAELEAARARRLAAEEAFHKIELEKKKQEQIKQAVLQAALKGGANLVQALAAQSGEGLGKVALHVDKEELTVADKEDENNEQGAKNKAKEEGKAQSQVEMDQEEEKYLASVEDILSSPRTVRCRRLLRFLDRTVRKQIEGLDICKWGCGDWVRLGSDQERHEKTECIKRILPCNLGCEVAISLEDWDKCLEGQQEVTFRQYHEEVLCVRRLVPCSNQCGEWVAFELLDSHLEESCVKRDLPPLACRVGCGLVFKGLVSQRLDFEEDRFEHEQHLCPKRIIRCTWEGCVALLKADDMTQHRAYHYTSSGFVLYTVAGTYTYTVPKRVNQLKVQLWGGGGGSGHMRGHTAGSGGGGAFVEALLSVRAGERIEIIVGSGGAAGQYGLDPDDPNLRKEVRTGEGCLGIAPGGQPGGGTGYSGNSMFACGGGGGYSMISKHGRNALYPVLVAGGGGGGGTRNATGGGGLKGEIPGTVVDCRSGRMGNHEKGGDGGSCPEVLGSRFPPQDGAAWQGGEGCEFGAGGGGGLFGGGGGGTSPGIAGAGGGGSSFVLNSAVVDYVILPGEGRIPGGVDRHPPKATGVGEWDVLDEYVGQGGCGRLEEVQWGRGGAVRIIRPGFFYKIPPSNDKHAVYADINTARPTTKESKRTTSTATSKNTINSQML